MRKLADDWATRRAAKEKAKQEKQKQAGDNKKWFLGQLSVPPGEWAQMYLRDAQSAIEDAYNRAEPIYETGDITALHKIVSETAAKIAKIKSNNDRGVAYYKNPNIIKNAQAANTFFSDQATYEDMVPYNNFLAKNPVHAADGSIAVLQEIKPTYEMELLTPDDFIYENNGNPIGKLKGTTTNIYRKKLFVSDAQKAQAASKLKNDTAFMQFALATLINQKSTDEITRLDLDRTSNETPQQFFARNPDFEKEVDLFVTQFVEANSSQPKYDDVTAAPPPPREKKDPTTMLVIQDKQTIPGKSFGTQNLSQEEKKARGLPEWAGGVTIPVEFDARINVSNSGTSFIPVTDEMIEMNPELRGLDNIQYQPGELLRVIKPDGSYGWYSTGKVTSYQADSGPYAEYMSEEEKQYTMQTLSPLMPINSVIASILPKYPDIMNVVNSSQGGGNTNSGGGGGGIDYSKK
jgi:hypothetical protein